MRDVFKITGLVAYLERMPSSKYGNPRYKAAIPVGGDENTGPDFMVAATTPDSMLGYTISAFEGKRVRATVGYHYGVLSLVAIKEED